MFGRTITLSIVLVAGLSAPASADDWVVRGRGFGHGVGMSQYGAYGMAQGGAGYRRILANYYRGTRVDNVGSRTIRVLLREHARSVRVRGAVRFGRRKAKAGRTYTLTRLAGSRVRVRGVGRFTAPLVVRGSSRGLRLGGRALNGVTDGAYRGALEVTPAGPRGLIAVNALSLDAYVQGVVPGEMPSSWAIEALKVQAVAARSYALTTDAGGERFDQYPDTRSQVYKGIAGETQRGNAAVFASRGEILTYRGRAAVTYYCSSSGGQTESVEYGFPGAAPTPYLRSVQDPGDRISPYHRWAVRFTTRQIQRRLHGVLKGKLRRVRIVSHGVSPRVVEAEVVGTKGRTRVTGATLRDRLGLRSTWFAVGKA